ncbi:MAG: tRNA 2-thiouridine(34) synthase MnmA [bacterium]
MTTVAIGMSGGLDSAVAAHRLIHETDLDVFGFTMRIGELEAQHDRTCCSYEDLMDAKKMCDEYGIPHYTIDVEDVFKENVVNPFVDSYLKGQTPNPCVWCNKTVKFGYLVEKIRKLGGDRLAMGHYAKMQRRNGSSEILRGEDVEKDQSYYMAFVNPDYLDYVWFPVGNMDKEDVRVYAEENDILVADKQESQSICFVPDMDYKKFIRQQTGKDPEPGPIVNIDDEPIGEHDGIVNYTIGQRRGLGISHHNPLYVLKIDPEENKIVAGERDRLMQQFFRTGPINWLADERTHCEVQIRYNGDPLPCVIKDEEEGKTIELKSPVQAIAPGQIAVFYDGDTLLGGSVIEEAPMPYEANPEMEPRIRPRAAVT